MVSDPIADMLTRIKNAYMARHQVVEIPYSKINEEISKILTGEGWLKKFKVQSAKAKAKKIICGLKYNQDGGPAIEDVKRISRPGRRVYARWERIPRALSGYGTTIVSTPKGMMTDKEARKKKLGGEIICKIW